MRRNVIRKTLLVLTAAALAVAGCTGNGTSGSTPKVSTTPKKAPATELADAASRLQDDTFTMTMTVKINDTNARLTGALDPPHKLGSFTATTSRGALTSVTEWRVIGNAVYLKTNSTVPGTSRKPWQQLNANQPGGNVADSLDGAKIADALRQATTVQRTGAGHYTGKIDISRLAKFFDTPNPSARPSAAPNTLAFSAELDREQRLTHYHLDVPLSKGGTYPIDIVYANFGKPVNIQPPPADQIAASTSR